VRSICGKGGERGGSLGGPNINGCWGAWSALENQCAVVFTQERRDPGAEVGADAALPRDGGQCVVVYIVESRFDV